MNILAIGAHPDDIEIFMYGILALFKQKGDIVKRMVATDGSLGGLMTKKKLVLTRKKESILALKEFGKPVFLNLPDGSLSDTTGHKAKLKKKIDIIKPDLIITHSSLDYHSDHRNLSKIVNEIACHYIPVLYCDTMMGVNFIPTHYIDITSVFNLKKKAVSVHKSQKTDRFLNLINLMNSYRAAQCNLPIGSFAEAYYFEKRFPFSSIDSYLPSFPQFKPFDINNQKGFL